MPPYGEEEWISWGYYPKNLAILFILIIALYTCIPLPRMACVLIGILVSASHFIALVVEYVMFVGGKNNDGVTNDDGQGKSVDSSEYSSYMLRLVSYFS